MSTNAVRGIDPAVATGDMKFEIVVIPVSDADRAKAFYAKLGWRLDADFDNGKDFRVIQFTPPGSGCSVIIRQERHRGSARLRPGPVPDRLRHRGPPAKHCSTAACRSAKCSTMRACTRARTRPTCLEAFASSGPDPEHRSYRSFASFKDPDGNGWLLQEITSRLPGRIDAAATTFASASDLANAMRRAEAAHGEHEKRTGARDENWPDWYAKYMVAEQAGTELPK